MGTIISIIILILALHEMRKEKCWYSPNALFCSLWGIISLLSSFHLFGMYQSSDYVYLIVLIGVISYIIGVRSATKNTIVVNSQIGDSASSLSKITLGILILFYIAINIKPFILSIVLQRSGIELADIRSDYFNQTSSVFDLILSVFTAPVKPIVEIAGICIFLKDTKKNIPFLLGVLLIVGMNSIITGGRWDILFVIIELIIGYSIITHSISFSSHNKVMGMPGLICLVALLLICIVAITSLRGIQKEDILKTYYMYLCGNIQYFEQHISTVEEYGIHPFAWSFLGVWDVILPFLNHYMKISYPIWYTDFHLADISEYCSVGDGMVMNAFSTPFLYLYSDIRILGVILGMLFFGYLSGYSYKKMKTSPRDKYIIIYLLTCQMILMTIFVYPFVIKGYALIFIYLIISHGIKRLFKKA